MRPARRFGCPWRIARSRRTLLPSSWTRAPGKKFLVRGSPVNKLINSHLTCHADAPKYINFCRGDYSDDGASDAPEENYKLAQFPRAGNPAFRSASPNPSDYSTQSTAIADPEPEQSSSRRDRGRRDGDRDRRDSGGRSRQKAIASSSPTTGKEVINGSASSRSLRQQQQSAPKQAVAKRGNSVPHNEYPLDGMTMYCRPGAMLSDSSLSNSPVQTPSSSHGGASDYSAPSDTTSGSEFSHAQATIPSPNEDDKQMKRKSGFFSGAPFRRKSKTEKNQQQQQQQKHQQQQQQLLLQQQQEQQQQQQLALREQRRMDARRKRDQPPVHPSLTSRNTWAPATTAQRNIAAANPPAPQAGSTSGRQRQSQFLPNNDRYAASPEPIDTNTSLALNVGGNIFDVSTPQEERGGPSPQKQQHEEEDLSLDPIAQALAELKGVTKNSTGRNSAGRNSADRYFGLATPAPSATPAPNSAVAAAQRGTPPPTYIPKSALDVPPPAFDSAQMQQTTQRYVNQRHNLLEGPPQMPAVASEMQGRPRSRTVDYQRPQSGHSARDFAGRDGNASPAPPRSVSPRPQLYGDDAYRNSSPKPQNPYGSRGPSPNPYTQSRPGTANSGRPGQYAAYNQGSPGPGQEVALSKYRTASPAMSSHSRNDSYDARSRAGSTRDGYGSATNRQSYYGDQGAGQYQGGSSQVGRPRSKSTVDANKSRDGRPIISYARAIYQYNAAIPEEMSFAKGDILAVLAHQEDGWWEAELVGIQGRPGLVPSNYLQLC